MKRLNAQPQSKRSFACPQCDKRRMTRDLDHEVSLEKTEYKTRDGGSVELFVDICDWCKKKNWHKYFEPSKADMKRLLKGIQSKEELDGDQSLEELL